MDRITLNEDIFYHVFDFLRQDGLFACQFLSKDIRQRVFQRIATTNDNHVIQIQDFADFAELFSIINRNLDASEEYLTEWLKNNLSEYVYGLTLKKHQVPIDKTKLYDAFSIHDIYLYFHDEFILDIARNERIMNSAIFRHQLYNGYQFFTKCKQLVKNCVPTWFTDAFEVDGNHCLIYNSEDLCEFDEITLNPKVFHGMLINNEKDSDNKRSRRQNFLFICVRPFSWKIRCTEKGFYRKLHICYL